MKKIYSILRIARWSFVGVYLVSSIYRYYDYLNRPDLYAIQSAPWYLAIQIDGIFTIIAFAAISLAMWIIKKKIK